MWMLLLNKPRLQPLDAPRNEISIGAGSEPAKIRRRQFAHGQRVCMIAQRQV
jgi:hypothetical protein